MQMRKNLGDLVIASGNLHKVTEIRKMAPPGFVFYDLKDKNFIAELPETSGSFIGNALQKARVFHELSGFNCIADDSGLVVDSLNGAPGVDSAFYAGHPRNNQANIELLLKNLNGVENRKAEFITVIALIIDDEERTFEGRVRGRITEEIRGESGFGYDPVFIPEGSDKTFAEMNPNEKNALSHRKIALEKLFEYLLSRNS